MTFVNVLFTLRTQPVQKAKHIFIRRTKEKKFLSKWSDCQINSSLTPSSLALTLHGGFAQEQHEHQREVSPCDWCWSMKWLSDTTLFSVLRVERVLFLTVWTEHRRRAPGN